MQKLTLFTLAILAFFTVSCGTNGNDFRTTDGGLQYRFLQDNPGENAQMGDVVVLHALGLSQSADTVLNSYVYGGPFYMMVEDPMYQGSIEEVLPHVSEGDSLLVLLNADSLYQGQLPEGVQPGENINVYLKIVRIFNEETWIDTYLQEQNITAERTGSGLRLYISEQGTGEQITIGDEVSVHYTGKLLDGTTFDSSLERDDPITLTIGQGQVIPGWEEALLRMRDGGRAIIILPSNIAYGERGAAPVIPPFAPLLFELQVVEVNGNGNDNE